jgi:hypothetical protein
MMKKTLWIAALAALGLAAVTQAAEISWSSVGLTTNATEVSTSGTPLEALNFNPVGGPTASNTVINGVTFSLHTDGTDPSAPYFSATSDSITADSHDVYPDGLLTAYDGLLSNMLYDRGDDLVTLKSLILVPAQQYLIQLFVADGRDPDGVGVTLRMEDGVFTSPTLDSNSGYGLVINGIFTADAVTQTFAMNKITSTGSVKGLQLSGYQLRAIPEPATLGLVVSFSGAILFIRRRLIM